LDAGLSLYPSLTLYLQPVTVRRDGLLAIRAQRQDASQIAEEFDLQRPSSGMRRTSLTHASELLRLGVPVHAVAERLGHRDGGALLLKTYAHVTDAVARDAADRLDSLFGKL
jgi:integrase